MKIIIINFIFFISILFCENFEFTLSSVKNVFYEEEEVILNLKIKNLSKENEEIKVQYLQPKEKNFLFVGENWSLEVISNNKKIENFTNHIPPEPKPGELNISVKPEEILNFSIPFPYYYYPLAFPLKFKVCLKYKNFSSNEIEFVVLESKGKNLKNSLILNYDFREGEEYPYGWKIGNNNVKWENKDFISFSLNKETAEGEGLWIYSIFNEIKTPSQYLLSVKCKSEGPNIIIFIEGWGIVKGRKRCIERNECHIFPENKWKEYNFNIKFENENVKWFRVKLYSYLNEGKVYFDRVELNKK
ncbi:MAG TPA: hypothetical protein PKV21_06965 [bacterium]|nr:hypothetical protein [bacterium]HOM27230.1 hypothetical protein [bacterium]